MNKVTDMHKWKTNKILDAFDDEYMEEVGEDLRLDRQTMVKYVTWMIARLDFIKHSTESKGCEHDSQETRRESKR